MTNSIEKLKIKFLSRMSGSKLPLISNPKVVQAVDHVLTMNFLRYFIIGISTVGIYTILYKIFVLFLHWDPTIANVIAYAISIAFNFFASNFWTFKAGKSQQFKKMSRYLTMVALNSIFTIAFFEVVSVRLHFNDTITQLTATAMIMCWNFFIYKFWVFKND